MELFECIGKIKDDKNVVIDVVRLPDVVAPGERAALVKLGTLIENPEHIAALSSGRMELNCRRFQHAI